MADATFQGMLNPRHRVPQIQWKRNKTHGIILCLLFRYFEKDNKAFERIFSAIFQNELWEYGFTSGVLFNRLNSQLVQMRKDEHAVWSDVFETPFDKNGPWSGFLRLIQDTATSSGIELKEKEDVITTSGYFLSPPQDTSPVSFELLGYKPYTNFAHRMKIQPNIYLAIHPSVQLTVNLWIHSRMCWSIQMCI